MCCRHLGPFRQEDPFCILSNPTPDGIAIVSVVLDLDMHAFWEVEFPLLSKGQQRYRVAKPFERLDILGDGAEEVAWVHEQWEIAIAVLANW